MTKTEFLQILSHYQTMCQLSELPDEAYAEGMYEELKHLDAREVAYAVRRIIAHEQSYNKYPMLADINKWLPDFRGETWNITLQGDELKRLQSQHVRETHVLYNYHISQIRRLLQDLTGDNTYRKLTDDEIKTAVQSKIKAHKDAVLNEYKPLLIAQEV